MEANVSKLLVNEMTTELIENSKKKEYFSGKIKENGDMFCLAILTLEDKNNLEIVIDLCDRDIEDGTYYLNSIKTNGKVRVGKFRLNQDKVNNVMLDNISELLKLTTDEEKLEDIKKEIDREIDENNNK